MNAWWLLVAGGGLIVLGASVAFARQPSISAAESRVFHAVNGLPDCLYPVLWLPMQLGNLVVGTLAGLAVAVVDGDLAVAIGVVLAMLLKLVTERIVRKEMADYLAVRQRPGTSQVGAILRGDVPSSGPSFPSGHVILVAAVAQRRRTGPPGRVVVVADPADHPGDGRARLRRRPQPARRHRRARCRSRARRDPGGLRRVITVAAPRWAAGLAQISAAAGLARARGSSTRGRPTGARSRISPSRIRVLTVPSPTPSCSATSTCVRPSKKTSSSACLCGSLNSASARRGSNAADRIGRRSCRGAEMAVARATVRNARGRPHGDGRSSRPSTAQHREPGRNGLRGARARRRPLG